MTASRPRPDVLVVPVHGELDELTAPEWTAFLRNHDADSSPYLVLDLAVTAFIGSTGLALLLNELEAVQASHQLFLTGVGNNRRVGRLLELVGVLDRFRTAGTWQQSSTTWTAQGQRLQWATTAITFRGNSFGNGLGAGTILPARPMPRT